MHFRTGLIVGLGVGYYYGSKAGRERFHQIDEYLEKVRGTMVYQDARTKFSDGFRETSTAARRLLDDTAFGGRAEGAGIFVGDDPTTPMNLRSIFTDPTLN